jgi:tetratricopeptide (TPR) repeat protein
VDIENLIRAERWDEARREIHKRLLRKPDSHWLLTRLGLTYYEQRNYSTALRAQQRALLLSPSCPLVLWDYAGALQMLGRHDEALRVYRRLVRRGVESIAYGDCGEGLAWARGLVADCHYRIMNSYDALSNRSAANRALVKHLEMRGPGCRSIYPLGTLAERRKQLSNRRESRKGAG